MKMFKSKSKTGFTPHHDTGMGFPRAPQESRDGAGFTLYELMVYIFIFSIFLFAVTTLFSTALKFYRHSRTKFSDITQNAVMASVNLNNNILIAKRVNALLPPLYVVAVDPSVTINSSANSPRLRIITVASSGTEKEVIYRVESGNLIRKIDNQEEIIAQNVDYVEISQSMTPDPYRAGRALYRSYKLKIVTSQLLTPGGTQKKTFSLTSQITPRYRNVSDLYPPTAAGFSSTLPPVSINDDTCFNFPYSPQW